jgi:thiamine biosynthesis protein ThiI
MSTVFVGHYSEIGLKGKNRRFFEDKLRKNIRFALRDISKGDELSVELRHKRLSISIENEIDEDAVSAKLKNVFGLVNFSVVKKIPSQSDAIMQTAFELMKGKTFNTFAVSCKRSDKNYPQTSVEVNVEVGACIVEKMNKKVDLSHPDVTCYIEIMRENTFVYVGKQKGAGGLPVDVSGRVLTLMSGGLDSPIAAYYTMKRGARCEYIHFHSYPYTSQASIDKVKSLIAVLNNYQFYAKVHMIPFSEAQEEIVLNCPDRMRIVLYRRFMMRIAQKVAEENNINAISTGDSLGQVASQTLANIRAINDVVNLPVLRPLIGLDKNEIMDKAREIGTYSISILPHDDACSRFMPKQPVINAKLEDVYQAEKNLDVDKIVEETLAKREILYIPARKK